MVKERRIIEGEEGLVTRKGGRVHKEIKEESMVAPDHPYRPLVNPLAAFYRHKIASLLFPGHVLEYSLAQRKTFAAQKEATPAVLESRFIETTPEHRAFNKWFYKNMHKISSLGMQQMLRNAPPEVKSHFRKAGSRKVKELAEEARLKGVVFQSNAVNIDFIGGKPFFFEVGLLYPGRLKQYLEENPRHPKRAQLETYLKRYNEASVTGGVYVPRKGKKTR